MERKLATAAARRSQERDRILNERRDIASSMPSTSTMEDDYPVTPDTPYEEGEQNMIDINDGEMIDMEVAENSGRDHAELGQIPRVHTPARIMELIKDRYKIIGQKELKAELFGGRVMDNRVIVQPLTDLLGQMIPGDVVSVLLQSIIKTLTVNMADNDLVGFCIHSPLLRQEIGIPLKRKDQLTPERILAIIEQILQSNDKFLLSDSFEIRVIHVRLPQGGRPKENCIPLDKFIRRKSRFVQITNDDNLCCARALVVAMAHAHRKQDPSTYSSIRRPKGGLQTRQATELYERVFGKDEKKRECGIPELQKFQEHLQPSGYQVVVYANMSDKGVIYKGEPADNMLKLFLHSGHFDVIVSLPAFLNKVYFCPTCFKGYDWKGTHSCINSCNKCKNNSECERDGDFHPCSKCRRFFKNTKCKDYHLQKGSRPSSRSICEQVYKCKCKQLIDTRITGTKKKHKCNEAYCERCKCSVLKRKHQCFIKPLPKLPNQKGKGSKIKGNKQKGESVDSKKDGKQKFIFFDFECRQDTDVGDNQHGCIFKHTPNLCVALRVCGECHDRPNEICGRCGIREHVFRGEGTLDKFCEWLLGVDENHKGVIAIAHNAKAYDTQFIQEFCHRNGITPKVLMNGSKILSLSLNEVKVIDSLSFLAMPLSSFPSTFQLDELKKGFFPHLFNTVENQGYEGPKLPPRESYDPDGMFEENRTEFNTWYAEHQNDRFNFQKELLEYCRSDVQILMEGCMAFRRLFMSVTKNVDPFQNITIAAACNTVFRTHFLQPDTIGLIPKHGYRSKDRHSLVALKWLKWVSHKEGITLQHAQNGGEYKICKYKVDGYHAESRTVYEFWGDIWHGCRKCYKKRDILVPGSTETVQDVYDNMRLKRNIIRKMGYTVVEMWECDFRKALKENEKMRKFVESIDMIEPINPRHSFYGGRTNSIKLYHKVQDNEKIRYVDVCSLYPYICKYAEYPICHPQIITENFKNIDDYFGIISCKVYPPRNLFHPVLPYRSEGKLLFPLCRTCVQNKQATPCKHTDDERALQSTWVTEEVKKAVELGYKVVKMYEVWHYTETSTYDRETQEGGLFSEYINLFLKVKQESSGWPVECRSDDEHLSPQTEEARETYLDKYREKEGVCLDSSKVKINKGLRAVGKICLNSFWGKFGQRNNLPQTVYFHEPEKFYSLITDPQNIVKSVNFPSEYVAQVHYVKGDEFVESLQNTNVVVAAFTTCWARLELYRYLEKLQKNVLYFDTDSIIYLKDDRVEDIPTGNFLGDMTDELEKEFGVGSYITELVALGPKNYSYKVFSKDQDNEVLGACKVRGITLNHRNAQLINFKSCAELVRGERRRSTVTNPHSIARTRINNVVTRTECKVHRMVYDKRVIINDFDTVPFGF